MAAIAVNAIVQHAAAHRGAADTAAAGASKAAGGLEALFATLLAASGADGANGAGAASAIETPQPGRANNTATRLAELLNGSARVAAKNGTGIAKLADAADTVTAKDKPALKTAFKTENEGAIPAALSIVAPDTAGIKKAAQTSDAQAIAATVKGHDSTPPNPAAPHAPAQAAGAQAGGKIEDAAAKPATPDLPAQSTQASQVAGAKPQATANAGRDKDLQVALAALQAGADKAVHKDIPVEKTAEVLPLQTVAAAVKADGQGGNSASSNAGGHDTPPQDHHDLGNSAPAKPQPVETAAAPLPANSNADALTPNPNAVAQTAPAHVSATLEVAPQSAAHPALQSGPDNQAVPLSNFGALAVSIAAKSLGGARQFDIGLHPAELGSIHVRLTVDHLGTAQAHLSAETPQTLALLQRDSHTLERALKDAGLNLAGNGLNFSLKGQDRQNGSGPQPDGRGRTLSLSAVASAAPADMASTTSLAPDGVRLDIRV